MKLITFSDYDGTQRTVPARRIVCVTKPSGRVHDHGSLKLDTGEGYGFNADSTAERIIRELEAIEDAP